MAHAQTLLRALDALPSLESSDLPGLYLNVAGRPGEEMVTSGLDASGLKLLQVKQPPRDTAEPSTATVFASSTGVANLRKKIEAFQGEEVTKTGRPKNADLAQSIGAITEAGLRALWRSPSDRFPDGDESAFWEVWLERGLEQAFFAGAANFDVVLHRDKLEFPEDIVVVVEATRTRLALCVRHFAGIRALAVPSTVVDFFDGLEVEEQVEWLDELQGRTTYVHNEDPNFITLLDTGINRAHPLIAPALSAADRHAADPAWDVTDNLGHGTELAGIALFGDLSLPLQGGVPIDVHHRLESVKILPSAGENPHHMLGNVTRRGINFAEAEGARRRTFAMACTTDADTPHDGAPTSWSTELDQLASGVSGDSNTKRLLLVSSGNSNQNLFGGADYLSVCDMLENEIESPAQAWNAICIGAYTEKVLLPPGEAGSPVAPFGDLSPSSRTASWSSQWPIKPDVVLEGGNWVANGPPPPMRHHALSLLTTTHDFPKRAFTTTQDTSAATALAARAISDLWADYPAFWPETVRGLFVSSARWTPQMLSHLPVNPSKGDYLKLLQRYGFGVPDMERARRSAANALTIIVEDQITPYRKSDTKGAEHVHNELRFFDLPWPVAALRQLGEAMVTLRVCLSTFVAPNPSEAARGAKYRYASHNLRFKLNRSNENLEQFLARINKASAQLDEAGGVDEDDGWRFGANRRAVGSIHIDQLSCRASDLARRNILAVHPVAGWWKTKRVESPEENSARFSLIVEIDTEENEMDIYSEVAAKVELLNTVKI